MKDVFLKDFHIERELTRGGGGEFMNLPNLIRQSIAICDDKFHHIFKTDKAPWSNMMQPLFSQAHSIYHS